MTQYNHPEKLKQLCKKFEPENKVLHAILKLGGTAYTEQIAKKMNVHPNDIISYLDKLDSLAYVYQKYGYCNYGATTYWILTDKGTRRAKNYYTSIVKEGNNG